jgi:hypothetical protein
MRNPSGKSSTQKRALAVIEFLNFFLFVAPPLMSVDRILRSAKPGDLPVQFLVKFDMVVNLTTAKALGLTVPPSVLVRATEVVE